MGYLINTTETYRLRNEAEAESFLKSLKEDPSFEVTKYTSTKKEKKEKKEVVDEWIRFTVTKTFNDEKEPTDVIDVVYEVV